MHRSFVHAFTFGLLALAPAFRPVAVAAEDRLSFAPAIERVREAVVTVLNLEELPASRREEFLRMPDFIRRPNLASGDFVLLGETLHRSVGHGSGAIVDRQGHVITNHHVIAPPRLPGSTEGVGGRAFAVLIGDSREFVEATIVGTDPATDIAVLRVSADKVAVVAEPADPAQARVGDIVIALGTPRDLALRHTATMGIISALERSGKAQLLYENYIQTDAANNPGNSGGPLLDVTGRVVGFNQSGWSSPVEIEGMGQAGVATSDTGLSFAIPVDLAFAIKDQLVRHGKVVRGYLGIRMRDAAPEEIAPLAGIGVGNGVVVEEILAGGPAGKGGLEPGDILLRFADQPLRGSAHLRLLASLTPPGQRVTLQIARGETYLEREVVLGDLESSPIPEIGFGGGPTVNLAEVGFGIGLTGIPHGIRIREVVEITSVDPASPAAKAGLKTGHQILRVNGVPVAHPTDVRQILSSSVGRRVLLSISDGKKEQHLSISYE